MQPALYRRARARAQGSHITAKTTLKSGFGASAGVCLGWADTRGFHMVGVRGKVGAVAKIGGDLMAGLHHTRRRVKAVLGYGNLVVELEFKLRDKVRRHIGLPHVRANEQACVRCSSCIDAVPAWWHLSRAAAGKAAVVIINSIASCDRAPTVQATTGMPGALDELQSPGQVPLAPPEDILPAPPPGYPPPGPNRIS